MVLTTLSEVAWISVWNTSHVFYILTSPRVSINYGPWLYILVNVFRIRKWMIGSQSTTSSGDDTSDSLLPSISTLLDWDPLQVHIPCKSVRLLLASVCVSWATPSDTAGFSPLSFLSLILCSLSPDPWSQESHLSVFHAVLLLAQKEM